LSLRPYFRLLFRTGSVSSWRTRSVSAGAHAPEGLELRRHAGLAGGDVGPVNVGYQEINQALVGFRFRDGLPGTMGSEVIRASRDGERAIGACLR
jgi:hypothetical protein